MTRLQSFDIVESRAMVRTIAVIAAVAGTLSTVSPSLAVTVVDMNFNGTTGLENGGIGPDGVLKVGATIGSTAGVGGTGGLVTDGSNSAEPAGAGLDLNIGGFGSFSGGGDFRVEFDFKSVGGDTGALFSADGSQFLDDMGGEFPGDQAGGLNVFFDGEAVVADLWFIGASEVLGTFNNDQFHRVVVTYDAAASELLLTVDGLGDDVLDGQNFLRDTTNDITRLGDENNPDFGVEFNDGCNCVFDNLLIEGPTPPPAKLIVDRVTGAMSIEVIAADPTTINSLSITSGAGTLEFANYLGADANNPSFDPNDTWQVTGSDLEIIESDAAGGADDGATLTNGQTFALGSEIWKPFFDEDVEFSLFDTTLGEEVRGIVEFTNGESLPFGDLNTDHEIDIEDYVLFRDNFDADVTGLSFYDAYFLADLNGDELHNYEDFIEFAAAYDDFNGEGAFVAMIQGVPEPGSLAIVFAAAMALSVSRFRWRAGVITRVALVAVALSLFANSKANAAELVEYLFDTNFNDTSGNNRHGSPSLGSVPTVSGGLLQLTGDFEEGLIVPLGAANPFGGLSDYTLEMMFNTSGSSIFPESGVILFGSADQTDPTNGDNQSLSIFIEPQADGGSLVVDYFFVGEVRIPDAMLLDGMDHTIKVTYVAPDDPGPEEEPNPGTMYINLDGDWLAAGEFAPRQPNPANYDTRIGGTLNEDFPFECAEGDCFTTELEGTVDNFRIFNEAMPPSLLRAEVDLTTGEVTLFGGEFHRDIRYYEINSDLGSIDPSGWESLELQTVDSIGTENGQHWDELTESENQLAEAFLLGSSLFDEDRSIGLGDVFTIGGDRDLEIIVVTSDLDEIPVNVSYVNSPGIPGDYNGNGTVELGDFNLVVANWGNAVPPAPASWTGDPPTAPQVDLDDFNKVVANWGETESSSEATGSRVPEPAAWLSALIAVAAILARRPTKTNGR